MCFSLWSRRTPYCRALRAERDVLPRWSVGDGDAHRPRGAGDDLLGGVQVVGVEVGHLALRDLANLRAADVGDLVGVRLAGALLPPRGLQDQPGGGGRLSDERERAVLVDGDLDGNDVAALRL